MERYIDWITRHRAATIGLTLIITVILALQATNLRIIIDPNSILPQSHPYVATTNKVEDIFGSRYVMVIGITPKRGDIYQPQVLGKVKSITDALSFAPGVVKNNILSLSARRAKGISASGEGLKVEPLMPKVPRTKSQLDQLKHALQENPVYTNSIVSKDERTTAIIADFKIGKDGFKPVVDYVRSIVDKERDNSIDISVGGLPVFLAMVETYSQRMAYLFPLAVLVVGLVLFVAFRTIQGLLLPLATALMSTLWGLGVMGATGVPLDVFNVSTPILIMAVAAGHAVQLLMRYQEEYRRLRSSTTLGQREASRTAVINSVTRIGPVMVAAGCAAALGFFSLTVFDILSVRTFGIFTGIGIFSAIALELTFVPALRAALPPPNDKIDLTSRRWDVWEHIGTFLTALLSEGKRKRFYFGVAFLCFIGAIGVSKVITDNSTKSLFSSDLPFQLEDKFLNDRLGGTNTLYLLVDGKKDGALQDPNVLKALASTQRFLEKQPFVGKTTSISDFIQRMNMAMHNDDLAYYKIPESKDLVSQYLLLYSLSGEPDDFNDYIDYGYRTANLWVFLKTDSTAYVNQLIAKLNEFTKQNFPNYIHVSVGGSVPQGAALDEVMVKSKLLNMIQIGVVVLIISSILFRSFVAGLLVLVPLAFAVFANFAIMGFTGIRLNTPTALTSAMTVGIGADYAIYLIYRLREELSMGKSLDNALHNSIATAGKASFYVAAAIASGYGVLLFSFGFYIHVWMAVLIATAMIVSVIATLTIVPALILTFRPNFISNGGTRSASLITSAVPLVLLATSLLSQVPQAKAADLKALDIMSKNFVVLKVKDSSSRATITLTNKSGQTRVRETYSETKLEADGFDNSRMTRFISPPDIKDTGTLLIEHSNSDDDIWIYLPALKRVRRLVANNKKDSFVGTDFSYGDIIGQRVKDWIHKVINEDIIDGKPCYVIESLPANAAISDVSGYSRRISWIRKDNYVLVKSEFWDVDGHPLKTLMFQDIKEVDPQNSKWQPMILIAVNHQTQHRTDIHLEDFKVNQHIPASHFIPLYLER